MLLYFDGFDYGASGSWTSGSNAYPWENGSGALTVDSTHARTGINGVQCPGARWRSKNIPATQTLYAGSAIRLTTLANVGSASVLTFADSGTEQVGLKLNVTGTLFFAKGSGFTVIGGPSFYALPLNQWHYIEVLVVISTTVGQVACWVDGAQVIALTTGLNTQSTGNASANQFGFGFQDITGSISVTADFDDLYVLDTTGPAPQNTRLGDVSISTIVPSASGSFTQWTIKPASTKPTNWQNVNEIPADFDTTYVFTATPGNRDSYDYAALSSPGIGTVYGVMILGMTETDVGGTSTIEFTDRQNGVDNYSPNIALGIGYVYAYWITPTDVNGNQWTVTNLNATEFGIKATVLGEIDIGLSDTNSINWLDALAKTLA